MLPLHVVSEGSKPYAACLVRHVGRQHCFLSALQLVPFKEMINPRIHFSRTVSVIIIISFFFFYHFIHTLYIYIKNKYTELPITLN